MNSENPTRSKTPNSFIPKGRLFLFTFLVVLAFGVRFWNLDSDPPVNLSASGGYFADEGYWTHNARNRVLFGESALDEWNDMYVSPLLHGASSLSFRLFGVTLQSARLVPVVLSLAIFLILYWILVREGRKGAAYLVLLFLGCHYPFVVYNRIAILETPATFLVVVAFIFMVRSEKWSLFLGGLLIGSAYLTKTTLLYIIPVSLLTIVLYPVISGRIRSGSSRRIMVDLLSFGSGIVIPVVLWIFLIYRPHGELLAGYNEYYRVMLLPSSISGFITALVTQRFHIFFSRTPVLLVVSHLYAALIFFDILDRSRPISRMELFTWFWYGSGILFLALFSYRPLRYYVPLIPAMAILSALFLSRLFHDGPGMVTRIVRGRRFYLILAWLLLPLLENLGLLIDRYLFDYGLLRPMLPVWPIVGIWYPGMIMTVLVSLLLISYFFYLRRGTCAGSSPDHAVKHTGLLLITLIVLFCFVNGLSLFTWLNDPQYTVLQVNDELARYPVRGAFTGQWAGELCLQTPHRVIPVYKGFVNENAPFSRYPIRYLMLWEEYNQKDDFFRDFPEIRDKVELVKEFRIKESTVYFFAKAD